VGEGNACALGVRRASQAALVLEAVRETTTKRTGRVAAATAATTTMYHWPWTFFMTCVARLDMPPEGADLPKPVRPVTSTAQVPTNSPLQSEDRRCFYWYCSLVSPARDKERVWVEFGARLL